MKSEKNHLTPKDIATIRDRFNYVVNRSDVANSMGDLSEYHMKVYRAGPGVFRIQFTAQPNLKGAKKHDRIKED